MCCIIYWIRMFGLALLRLIFIHVNIKRGEGEESKRISTDFLPFELNKIHAAWVVIERQMQ